MLKCPNCGEKTIKDSIKLTVGPIDSLVCDNCHAKVSVPYWSSLMMSSVIAMMYLIGRLNLPGWLSFSILILSCVGVLYTYYRFVPLVVKLQEGDDGYGKQKIVNALTFISILLVLLSIIYIF